MITLLPTDLVGSAAQFRAMVQQEAERAPNPSDVQIVVTVKPPAGPLSSHVVVLGHTTETTYRSPERRAAGSSPAAASDLSKERWVMETVLRR